MATVSAYLCFLFQNLKTVMGKGYKIEGILHSVPFSLILHKQFLTNSQNGTLQNVFGIPIPPLSSPLPSPPLSPPFPFLLSSPSLQPPGLGFFVCLFVLVLFDLRASIT
jgi:hypothetical protein